jgi:hypothetical protein
MFYAAGDSDLGIGGGGFADRCELVSRDKGASEQSLHSNCATALSGFNRALAAPSQRSAYATSRWRPSMRFCALRRQVVCGS